MRVILKEDYLKIPNDVEITCKARKVTVKGARGTIKKDFTHVALDIQIMDMQTAKMQGKHARIQMWNAGYKQACSVTTIKSLISNMIIGVTEGFRYKMRLVHAHFPITAVISKDQKDELVFDGIDNALLSQSCARVCQVCKIGN